MYVLTVSTARQLGFAVGIALLGRVFETGAEASLAGSGVADSSGAATPLSAGQAVGHRSVAIAPQAIAKHR